MKIILNYKYNYTGEIEDGFKGNKISCDNIENCEPFYCYECIFNIVEDGVNVGKRKININECNTICDKKIIGGVKYVK